MGGRGRRDTQGHNDRVAGILQKPLRSCSAWALSQGSVSSIFPWEMAGLGIPASTVCLTQVGDGGHSRLLISDVKKLRPWLTANIPVLVDFHPPPAPLSAPPWTPSPLHTFWWVEEPSRAPCRVQSLGRASTIFAALEPLPWFGSQRRVWLSLGRVLWSQGWAPSAPGRVADSGAVWEAHSSQGSLVGLLRGKP